MGVPTLAPDPVLPARDLLLDPPGMTARLQTLLGVAGPLVFADYAQTRVKYRVGQSLRVVHRFTVDGTPQIVASRTFPAGKSEPAYRKGAAATPGDGSLKRLAHDPALETVFWTFPNDRKIGSLSVLGPDVAGIADVLGQPVVRTRIAAYAPEKSATAACFVAEREEPAAYAKVYADATEAALSHALHAELSGRVGEGDPHLRLPRTLGFAAPFNLLCVESISGVRIDELRGRALAAGMERFGAAVATLHCLPAPHGAPRFDRLDPARLAGVADLVGTARPDLRTLAQTIAGELAEAFVAPDDAPGCLHGDVHWKNGILQDRRVVLIDLDQVSTGSAAAELGSVCAAIRFLALADRLPRTETDRLESAFLAGYAGVRDLPSGSQIRWHAAAALLIERALRAVNRIRRDGLIALPRVLREAQTELQRGGA